MALTEDDKQQIQKAYRDVLAGKQIRARYGQRLMIAEIAKYMGDIDENDGQRTSPPATCVVEAGTGTGKTFAYLVPALKAGKKIVISTGTKALQEQLFLKDLPRIRDALGTAPALSLLKGRANYLCLARLKAREADTNLLDPALLAEFTQVTRWAPRTESGDIAELPLPEDAGVFPHVTSTAENCLGRDCPHFEDCYLVKARKKAMDADLVVINHHLFFADMAIRDTGFGEGQSAARFVKSLGRNDFWQRGLQKAFRDLT